MAIQRTRWEPDTCECIIEYEWDDSLAPDLRVIAPANIIQRCLRHTVGFNKLTDHFDQLMAENPRKGKILSRLKASFPSMFDTLTGEFLGSWYYDSQHVIHVKTLNITKNQMDTIQTYANSNLGVGKVVIE